MNYIIEFLNEFYHLFLEMSPYLLLGFLFAGILYVYLPKEKLTRYLGGNNFLASINASLIGVPLPLCSCGVIPSGISLYKNGASKGSSISFLISTPQTGIDSIMVTYSLIGLPFAIMRTLVAFITGIFGGFFTSIFTREEKVSQKKVQVETIEYRPREKKIKMMFRYAFVEFLQDLAKWLIIGLALAALIAAFIPDDFFTKYLDNELLSMLIILVASIPIYVCATGSVPIAAVLLMKGLSPGAALVFLMAGPATNIATITLIGKSLGRKSLIIYLFSIILGALLSGLFINYFLPREMFITNLPGMHGGHENHLLPMWLVYSSAITLALLIINGFIQKYLSSKKTKELIKQESRDMKKVYKVRGMSCKHCVNSVETNLKNIRGIKEVKADLASCEVAIEGETIDQDEIKKTVEGLGYTFEGEK